MSKVKKCPECKRDIKSGKTQLIYEVKDVKISIKNVAARVCQSCGQAFISPQVASEINSFVKSQPDMAILTEYNSYT